MKTIEVTVTAEHIAVGVAKDCGKCPIALALREMYPGSTNVDVSTGCAIADYRDGYLMVSFPPEAAAFVEAFDAGHPVSPFTFTATVKEEA